MKHALVAGASGLVGQHLIELLLADDRYTVTALVRAPLGIEHKKLQQAIFDFEDPGKNRLAADEVFCCLGTTIKTAGSREAFYKVDVEYVQALAQAGFSNGAKKFALVSSMGANKDSRIFYNKAKGLAEEAVTRVGYDSLFILRPSLLLGKRKDFRWGEMTGKFIMKIVAFALPLKYKPIAARQVARAMLALMNSGKEGITIVESDRIALW